MDILYRPSASSHAMKLPRPRFTVRWLMIVVGLAGLGLGAEAYRRHLVSASARYHATAGMYRLAATMQDTSVVLANSERKLAEAIPDITPNPEVMMDEKSIARCCRLAAHSREMAAKYDHAARYPWLPVEPDPPVPE
jgi:hypothetical protein